MARIELVPDRELARKRIRDNVPVVPGVYGWLDDRGQLVYVGKSKSLRMRLVSYFAKNPTDDKMLRIRQRGRSLVWEPVCHELLALIREQELIDRWRPVYNSQGQPDKRQPAFLCISSDAVPKAFLARNAAERGQKIFGPIAGTGELREAITSLNYVFQMRDCPDKTKMRFGNQLQLFADTYAPGCLRYELSSCPAPCAAACTEGEYLRNVDLAVRFLEGKDRSILKTLESEMNQAGKRMAYERASVLRDQWKQLQWLDRRFKDLRKARQEIHGSLEFRGFHGRRVFLLLNDSMIEVCLDDRDLKNQDARQLDIPEPNLQKMPQSPLEINWQMLLIRWFKKNKEDLSRISKSPIQPIAA